MGGLVDVIIYHNPRCSKSRRALELLRGRGVEPHIIEYLKTPPSFKELADLLERLGLEPRDIMRKKEKLYAELDLQRTTLGRDQLIQALAEHPALLERPIVLAAGRAALGRPPENVLEIL